eukprot:scaffold21483_cov40-Tisochrysis_lutea.AAC.3
MPLQPLTSLRKLCICCVNTAQTLHKQQRTLESFLPEDLWPSQVIGLASSLWALEHDVDGVRHISYPGGLHAHVQVVTWANHA